MIVASVVAEHLLAQQMVHSVIERCKDIRTVPVDELNSLSRKAKQDLVLVIDGYGLALPLNECLRCLRDLCPKAKALLLHSETSPRPVTQALWAGVQGVLSHSEVPDGLVSAIRRIHGNGNWLPENVVAYPRPVRTGRIRESRLTTREEQVLMWIEQRLYNDEIAGKLDVTENTVKFYVRSILAKLQVASRRELVKRSYAPSRIRLFTPVSTAE